MDNRTNPLPSVYGCGRFCAGEIEDNGRESRQRSPVYLTGSTGQIHQEIPRKEEVASVFLSSIRSWKTMEESLGNQQRRRRNDYVFRS